MASLVKDWFIPKPINDEKIIMNKKEITKIGIININITNTIEKWHIEIIPILLDDVDFFILGIDQNNKNYILDKITEIINTFKNKKFYTLFRNEDEIDEIIDLKNIRLISSEKPVLDIIDNVIYKKILVVKPIAKNQFRNKYISSNPELSLLYAIKNAANIVEADKTLAVILFYNNCLVCLNPRDLGIPYIITPTLNPPLTSNNNALPGSPGIIKLILKKENVCIEFFDLLKIEEEVNKHLLSKFNKIDQKIVKFIFQNTKSIITIGKISHFTNISKQKIIKIIDHF